MKTIKRSIAFVLAMILTLAMSVTVFAEGEGAKKTFTITVLLPSPEVCNWAAAHEAEASRSVFLRPEYFLSYDHPVLP